MTSGADDRETRGSAGRRAARGGGLRKGAALACLAAAAWLLSAPAPLPAHTRVDPQDEILRSIGVDERPGEPVPAGAVFRDQTGKAVRLGDWFGEGPVLLTLNYYTCPMLCPLTLRSLRETATGIRGISLARDFRIVTVSIDPEDGVETAGARAAEIHAGMEGIASPASRWPFLTGDPEAISALAEAVGFRYRKVGAEFAHPDVAILLTPEGRISRYLHGVQQDPGTLKLALIEAAGGRIGESEVLNRVLMFCFRYDPEGRKYALYARNVMKAGGVLTLALLGAVYLVLWRRRKRIPGGDPGGSG